MAAHARAHLLKNIDEALPSVGSIGRAEILKSLEVNDKSSLSARRDPAHRARIG